MFRVRKRARPRLHAPFSAPYWTGGGAAVPASASFTEPPGWYHRVGNPGYNNTKSAFADCTPRSPVRDQSRRAAWVTLA